MFEILCRMFIGIVLVVFPKIPFHGNFPLNFYHIEFDATSPSTLQRYSKKS